MLRIIAGKYRHLIIEAPSTNTTRPTTDKVREAVMSSLGTSLIDATILDLFAGSGANCGACGFPGCAGLAQAMADKKVKDAHACKVIKGEKANELQTYINEMK